MGFYEVRIVTLDRRVLYMTVVAGSEGDAKGVALSLLKSAKGGVRHDRMSATKAVRP